MNRKEMITFLENTDTYKVLSYAAMDDDESNYVTDWDEYLPEMTADQRDTFFMEFAEIYPKYRREHNPRVRFHIIIGQGSEGIVPHLHMHFRHKDDKDQRYISYVCLHEATYAPQHKNSKRLNAAEKEELIKFLNTFRKGAFTSDKDDNPIPCNCWQECVDTWINTYDDRLFKRDEDGMVLMPDYNDL